MILYIVLPIDACSGPIDDAINTGYLIEKLEMNQEFQLVSFEMPEKSVKHIGCCLGELFAGLNLKLA